MAERYSLRDISLLKSRKIFFDANVLIYIFWPTGSFSWENSYSSIFRRLLLQKNEIVVDFIVISEVINRAIRIEYEKYLNANNLNRRNFSFKQFRDSTEGEAATEDIYSIVSLSILPIFNVQVKGFSKSEIESFLNIDSLDFSDKAILSICKENDFVLLTNDRDFRTSDIEILTSNRIILKN